MRAAILSLFIAAAASAASGQVVYLSQSPGVQALANGVKSLSDDGRIAVGWQRGLPAVWDLQSGNLIASQPNATGQANCVTGNGSALYAYTTPPRRCSLLACNDLSTVCDADGFTFRSIWDASYTGGLIGGLALKNGLVYPAILRPGQPAHVLPEGRVTAIAVSVSGDGSTAFFIVTDPPRLRRWRSDGVTDVPGPFAVNAVPIGCSVDGSVAYVSSPGKLFRYGDNAGLVEVEGLTAGAQFFSMTPDGRRGVGGLDVSGSPRELFMWEPFTGITLLGLSGSGSQACISADGQTIAGSAGPGGQNRAFYMRVPPPVRGLDYSRDGNVDQNDVAVFVDLVAGAPNTLALPLDFNDDGNTDADDVSDLISCIAGGCP